MENILNQQNITEFFSTQIKTEEGQVITIFDFEKNNLNEGLIGEAIKWKIKLLKKQGDEEYGDYYNRLVCQKADELQGGFNGENLLGYAESEVKNEIAAGFSTEEAVRYSLNQRMKENEKYLEEFRQMNFIEGFQDEDKLRFAKAWYILSEFQPYPFSDKVSKNELRRQLAESVFLGKDFNLVTLVCMSYIHEKLSEPGTVSVTPGEIIKAQGRDNDDIEALEKFEDSVLILKNFLGDKVKPFAILSDIDFVEVFKVRDEQKLKDADDYYRKYQQICLDMGFIPISMRQILQNPAMSANFNESLRDIRGNIDGSSKDWNMKRPEYYVPFPFVGEQAKSIYDYYNSLPGVSMRWEVALQNTIDKYALYGSQPEILRQLFGRDFILMSSEFPVRDQMYRIRDKKLKNPLMPVIYPIQVKNKS